MFSDDFDVLMLKIIFKKYKKYYFDTSQSKNTNDLQIYYEFFK